MLSKRNLSILNITRRSITFLNSHQEIRALTALIGSSRSPLTNLTLRRLNATASAANAQNAAEKHEFQAEIASLLEIVAKSLYSDQEVFVRELISNASDALEKRKCLELSDETKKDSASFELRIDTDESNRRLIFSDTGIGMNREELVDLLGTIAKSGSKAFKNNSESKQTPVEAIIGQFGVGFYSAFVVSEKVVVTTRKLGEPMGYCWTWNGGSHFEIAEEPNATVGTKVELQLRQGETEQFSQAQKIVDVINKYSYFLTVPIFVNGERINVNRALWTMSPSETTPEMHETFFKQLAKTHHPHLVDDRPQYTIAYQTDSPINLRALFYVPSRKVSQLEFATVDQQNSGISLYNQRVLIKAHVKELLPHYLRFLVGVVDSEDIPLNLSREMLQNDVVLEKIRKILTDRIVRYFVSQMDKDRTRYGEFYRGYSLFLKEGIVTEPSNSVKEEIAKLLLFESSNSRPGVLISLREYVARMQADQKSIYYLYAPSRQLAESSPYFELFKSRNLEALFISDPADELVFLSMPQFEMKKMESVEQWARNEGLDTKEAEQELIRDTSKREFIDWLKLSLGGVRANSVIPSTRKSTHPFIITVTGDMGAARHMMRIAEIRDMEHLVLLKPQVHVNFLNPVVRGLMRLQKKNPELAEKIAEQVYDNALVTAGLMKDPTKMVGRINTILSELLETESERSPILTP